MIDRPVFAAVISVLITLLGAIAYPNLGASLYPSIVPPTVNITLTYAGASAETLAETVAEPMEEQINGVEDMIYMSSQSTGDGNLQITVTFKLGTDLDKAQELVQDRVTTATPRLPPEVQQTGITVRKSSPDILMAVHMYSPDGSLDQAYVANYVTLQIAQPLLRVPGVGDLTVRAARDYAIRIWIDPDKAAARSLTVEDIVGALRSHNVQIATGNIGAPPFGAMPSPYQLQVQAEGRLVTPQQFADIVIKRDAGNRITRVSDVARVDLGAAIYTTNAYLGFERDGVPTIEPAAAIGVLQQPGTNALEAADGVIKEMTFLRKSFPPGLDYRIIYNPTDYIRQSIKEVYRTLFEALLLVVLVVIVFLQSWRAAIIPILAIPVALIGTCAVMLVAGFTLNTLSLFGLVLAIGIVVDDAIVVVENVERHLEQGMSPRDAAHLTMDEVGGALIAIALVLSAVFIPAAFISGISGQFYRQFALTIATATLLSLLVSVTLSPALAALILRPPSKEPLRPPWWARPFVAFARFFNWQFERLAGGYANLTGRLTRVAVLMLIVYAGVLALTGWRIVATPNGFIPAQDQGNVIMSAVLPTGASLARTDQLIRKTIPLTLETPGIVGASSYAGVDATTQTTNSASGQAYLIESSFEDREKIHTTLPAMIARLQESLAAVAGAAIRILPPPPVRGIGTQGGVKMILENRSGSANYQQLEQTAQQLVEALNHDPSVSGAYETFNTKTPRIFADIDRVKAEYLGVSDTAVFDALQTFLGSTYINDFNYLNHTYEVYAQADAAFRQDEAQILQLQTRSANGAMMPLGAVVNLRRTTGPYRVLRYQLYPSAEVQASTPPGYSTGQTMAAMERIAQATLPDGFGYEWTELAYQQRAAGNTAALVFGLAVTLVFLLLAALYECVTMPLAVILIVPMCLLAAITGVNLMGLDDNILTQIGFIVLIGLAAKNAILIVEFARQGELEKGHDRFQAAVEAARTRLRPILMTSFAFILGVVPLAFATGAGSELRRALGAAVFFGMIGVTCFGLIFTPVFYVVTRWLNDKLLRKSHGAALGATLLAVIALAALGGCAVGPRYAPPVAPAPSAEYFAAGAAAIASVAQPPPNWWQLYASAPIDHLVEEALTHNKNLLAASANLAAARAALSLAGAGRYPSTLVSAGDQYGVPSNVALANQLRDLGAPDPQWYFAAGLDVSYEVDLFGRVRRTVESAAADYQAQQAAEDVTRISVAAETTRAYVNACAYAQELDVARHSLDLVSQNYELTVRQAEAGAATDFDVARALELVAKSRATLPVYDGDRRTALFELAVLTGRPPEEISADAGACTAPPKLTTVLPVGDVKTLFKRRPDVRQAERQLAGSVARVGVATADLYPTIRIGIAAQSAADTVRGLGYRSNLTYALGPLLSWSFPNVAVAQAQVRAAQAGAAAAYANFQAAVLQALQDTENALTAYGSELDRNASLESARAQSRIALHLAETRFQLGHVSYLDLLTAETDVVNAEAALAASNQALVSDQVTVFKALGGGWEQAPAIDTEGR